LTRGGLQSPSLGGQFGGEKKEKPNAPPEVRSQSQQERHREGEVVRGRPKPAKESRCWPTNEGARGQSSAPLPVGGERTPRRREGGNDGVVKKIYEGELRKGRAIANSPAAQYAPVKIYLEQRVPFRRGFVRGKSLAGRSL